MARGSISKFWEILSKITDKILFKRRLTHINDIPIKVTSGFIAIYLFVIMAFVLSDARRELYFSIASMVTPVRLVDFSSLSLLLLAAVAVSLVTGVYVSVLLHELGHATAAQRYSYGVDCIQLWVLGGLAKLTRNPTHPRSEFFVTVAGPAVTFVIASVTISLGVVASVIFPSLVTTIIVLLGLANAGMLLLNLLPIFPLDGGRLLRSFFSYVTGSYTQATKYTSYIGLLGGGIISLAAVITFQPIVLILGIFIAFNSRIKYKQTNLQEKYLSYPDFSEPHSSKPTLSLEGTTVRLHDKLLDEQVEAVKRITHTLGGRISPTRSSISPNNTKQKLTYDGDVLIVPESLSELDTHPQVLSVTQFLAYYEGDGNKITQTYNNRSVDNI